MNTAKPIGSYSTNISKKREISFVTDFRKNIYLYLLMLPGLVYFIIFKYLPMVGVIIAFKDFNYVKGIFKSPFVGFKNFEFFLRSNDWLRVAFNTIYLNVLFIITGLIFSIGIAIVLSEIRGQVFKKVTQSIVILPHFISWTLVAMLCLPFLSSEHGVINKILVSIGLEPVEFYSTPEVWPTILVILKIWKGAGYNSIIYLAAIAGLDQEIFEAAKIDGASRLQCIFRITIPQLRTTAVLLTLLSIGGIFYGDFGMIYALVGDNSFLFPTTDVIDTYVYRQLRKMGEVSMSAAVGLFQSVVGFIIVIISNKLAKRFDPDAAIY